MTRTGRVLSISMVLCCCFFLVVSMASAQVKSSTITGIVTDSTGGSVVGASVTITNMDTAVVTAVKSNKEGNFTAPYLEQGKYAVQVEVSGFKTYKVDGLVLGTDTILRVNAALAVGALSDKVEVNASAAQLQTESGGVQGAVGTDLIMNIPNITNNPLSYATLQAGVLPTPAMANGESLGVGYEDRIGFSGMNINGSAVGTNDVQIDGLSVQGTGWHEATVLPNRDALQEVRVNTNALSADLGGGQGVISIVTKSGTNQFHGDLNYRMRNEAFNANGLANNLQKLPRGKYRLSEGGGAIGGPVIIPHVFNGTDKVFFFVSFSRLTHVQPSHGYLTVPTAQQRTGDFGSSLIADLNGNPVPAQLYNPFQATPYAPSGGTAWVRPEYPRGTCSPAFLATYGHCGDMVTNPNAAALLYMNAYPLPNHTSAPTDVFGNNNYFFSGIAPEARNNLSARMDFHFGKHSVYTSGGVDTGYNNSFNAWGKNSIWYNPSGSFFLPSFNDFNPYVSVGDTVTLNITTVLDVRVGVTRLNAAAAQPVGNKFSSSDYTTYGMPAAVQQLISVPGSAPVVGSPGLTSLLNQNGYQGKHEHQTNYMVAGSVTKIRGKWTLRNGAEYRLYLGNWADLLYSTPALAPWGTDSYAAQYANIDGTANSTYNLIPQQGGYPLAPFATGVAGWLLTPGSATKPALTTKYYAFYSQNDWKATRKLTLNLGLRYEIQPASTERYNRMTDVDLTAPNPYASGITLSNPLGGMGAIAIVGHGGYGRGLWNTQWNDFSPRVGAAYKLTDSMVVRGGFGRLYTPSNTGFNANGTIYGPQPFENGANAIPFGIAQNGLPVGTFDQPQNTQIIIGAGPVQSPTLYGCVNGCGQVDFFQNKDFKNGYLDQWNATFEKRLHGWVTSAAYVGSRGANLGWREYNINGEFNVPWATLMGWQQQWEASNGSTNPGFAQVPNPLPQLVGKATGPIGNATIPYQDTLYSYLGLLNQTIYASKGSSRYHSLQLRAEHPFAHGLSALFNYTWSRATGVSGGQLGSTYAAGQVLSLGSYGTSYANNGSTLNNVDYRNFSNNNSLLNFDTPQRFVAAVHYELPIGKGKQFDPHNGVANAIIGGWKVDPIITLQSGQPWAPTCSSENGRCIPTGEPLELPKSYQHWYDGATSVTLPDGRTITPLTNTYLKWNPDAFTQPLVKWADGSSHVAEYWLGTTAMFMGSLRMPWYNNVNLDVSKSFQLTERANVQLLAEATNLFNKQILLPGALGGNNGYYTNNNGLTSSGASSLSPAFDDPRQLTLSLRVNF